MQKWLSPAVEYLSRWMAFQMRASQQPGCVMVVLHKDRVVWEQAFGLADASKGVPLTPRHRFRVASHSKSFTAAGVMKLREQRKLKLDHEVGRYVQALHPRVARVTLAQLLSHSGGLIRDGEDAGFFFDRRAFPTADELMADLQAPPILKPNTRFKYSNHGYGLIGLALEAITGEPFTAWLKREIIDAAGLKETYPDMPIPRGVPMASGHSGRLLLGKRVVIPGNYSTRATAPAGGVISTARDLAWFFSQLSPRARHSVLSAASRREMVRRRWRIPDSSIKRYYGLGISGGASNGWDWFGHSGGLQGYITRTCVIPQHDLTLAVCTNAIDGWAGAWTDGVLHVLQAFAKHGAPSRKVHDWVGRWWSLWGALDLVPMGNRVLMVGPGANYPFTDAGAFVITGRDRGRITQADGYSSFGEAVRRVRARNGKVAAMWLGSSELLPESAVAKEMQARYVKSSARQTKVFKKIF